jgi:pre-rRNA-processing protein IPI3
MQEVAISYSKTSPLTIWDIHTGVTLQTYKSNQSASLIMLPSLSHSSHPHILAPQADKSLIHVYNLSQATPTKWVMMEALTAITAHPSAQFVVGGGKSGRVYLWHTQSGRMVRMFDAHYSQVTSLCFSCDGETLVTAGYDSSIHAFSLTEYLQLTQTAERRHK